MSPPTIPASRVMEETANGLFFIVGCGRSGTTLLQVMLDSHSEIALPNETHFFCVLHRRNHQRIGSLETPGSFEKALDLALSYEHIEPIGLDRERVRELAATRPPSWEALFLALMAAFRELRGVTRVGEKTPAHVLYLQRLYREYPHARFIHVIRDPRGVIASYLKAPFYRKFQGNPYHAINSWRSAIDIHFAAQEGLDPARYTSVRYEDLVESPRSELQRLSGFLGIPFEERMLEFHTRSNSGFLQGETHKLGTLKPVYRESTELWHKDLSPKMLELIEGALGTRMKALGYGIEARPGNWKSRVQMGLLFLEYKTRVRVRRVLEFLGLLKGMDLGGIAEPPPQDSLTSSSP
ncbi:MAG TPA: sulfotransferase [Fimbriimonas sp.]